MQRVQVLLLVVAAGTRPVPALGDGAHPEARHHAENIEALVDAYFAPYVAGRDFAGIVLIARGDDVLLRKSYGAADVAFAVPHSANSKFAIASVTKTFTAAAVVMLHERGRLRFEDCLDRFLPEYPKGDQIRIQHLLDHESGVPNPDYDAIGSRQLTPDELIATFKNKPLDFPPGTKEKYSNAGYILLARVVEIVSGRRFHDFLRDEIFTPLGMADTGSLQQGKIIRRLASGYVPGPPTEGLENAAASNPSLLFGSGSLYSTVDDLLRWGKAVRSERLFRRSALKYPFGWGKRKQYGHDYVEQTGRIPGFLSHLIVFFDQPVCVVCLGNVESGIFSRLAKDLTILAFGGVPEKGPMTPNAATLDPRHLDSYVGRYRGPWFTLRLTRAGDHLYSSFDDAPSRSYLLPTSADELFMRSEFTRIRATRDENGRVSHLTIWWGAGGDPMNLPRIDAMSKPGS